MAKKEAALLANQSPVPVEVIQRHIFLLRSQKVMLSSQLAELYKIEPRALVQAVKRNLERFPEDFMFQLSDEECVILKSQTVISSWGGARRANPYAFTELGVAMLSSVLKSQRAVQMNILIMRAFVRLRGMLATQKHLARKIDQLERTQKDHTSLLEIVVDDIQSLGKHVASEFKKLKEPRRRKARIGFKIPDKP